MNCQDLQKFIYPYVDGEFAEQEKIEVVAHLQQCEQCSRIVVFEENFRSRVKGSFDPVKMPKELQARIGKTIEAEQRRDHSNFWKWSWRLAPVGAVAAFIVGFFVFGNEDEPLVSVLAEQTIQRHRQVLPMDVSGQNPEAVSQFFRDKVSFAVRPPKFEKLKAQFVGARLTNLREHQAAYLRYLLGNQPVSVFIVDSNALPSGGRTMQIGNRRVVLHRSHGYNVALYKRDGVGYAVASDMDPQNLVHLISAE